MLYHKIIACHLSLFFFFLDFLLLMFTVLELTYAAKLEAEGNKSLSHNQPKYS